MILHSHYAVTLTISIVLSYVSFSASLKTSKRATLTDRATSRVSAASLAATATANANAWRQDAVAARERLNPQKSTRTRKPISGTSEDRPIDGDDLYSDATALMGGIARGRLISAKKLSAQKSAGVFGRIGSWFKRFFG